MENSLFYCHVERTKENKNLITALETFSREYSKSVYVIREALGTDNEYSYNQAVVILIPKCKITLVDCAFMEEEFEEFVEDYVEDLGSLSDRYEYKKHIGRPRTWRESLFEQIQLKEIDTKNISAFIDKIEITEPKEQRKIDFLISLLTGSINNIDELGVEVPENILDQVKKKIVLFDGDQTRFIYNQTEDKVIRIQGLAGTGKTELLLHKLKEIYTKKENKDARIAFSCFNKILARSMKKRIPDFFTFMKVDEQIKWDEKLWVFSSWGSRANYNSGLYRYICYFYDLPFETYGMVDFSKACENVINALKQRKEIQPCFDYLLIDESQDFKKEFFEMCEMITGKKLFIAGDIFQDIYDRSFGINEENTLLLNKCYRTDPKTLMFAHAIEMGLFEKPVIRWLEDEEWKACGYQIKREENNRIKLMRSPLRRFEDLEASEIRNIEFCECDKDKIGKTVLDTIAKIKDENPTVRPDDIAIVFLYNNKQDYSLADWLQIRIAEKFEWDSVKGYEVKNRREDSVFISNRNDIKGLEFPFVICVAQGHISRALAVRNTLYMMLTRSFLTSYFIVDNVNKDFIGIYQSAVEDIQKRGYLCLNEPSDEEKKAQNYKVMIAARKNIRSSEELLRELLDDEYSEFDEMERQRVEKAVIVALEGKTYRNEEEYKDKARQVINVIL